MSLRRSAQLDLVPSNIEPRHVSGTCVDGLAHRVVHQDRGVVPIHRQRRTDAHGQHGRQIGGADHQAHGRGSRDRPR